MTRADALTKAKENYAAYRKADTDHLFGRGPAPIARLYGYRHGWVIVGEFAFNNEELTGQPYDATQGGWGFV